MCFSASASFAVSAMLLPTGIGCLALVRSLPPKWLPLAIFPIAFSIQQALEGSLWLALASENQQLATLSAKGFLFFSHFFWLVWVPFATYKLEENKKRKAVLFWMIPLGLLAGASVLLPLLYFKDWVIIEQTHHSLQYKTILIYDDYISRTILRGLYGIFIVLALCISSIKHVRYFGVLIALSLLIATHFYSYALISVWCFFAALLSCYILYILVNEHQQPHAHQKFRK